MLRFTRLALGMVLGGLVTGPLFAAPIKIVKKSSHSHAFNPAVLFEDAGYQVVRTPQATDENFKNLYVVRTPFSTESSPAISGIVEVEGFVPGQFAVVRIPEAQVEAVSGRLHAKGLACGVLFKLEGDTIPNKVAEVPEPLVPVALRDADVARVVQKVDPARIQATVEELAAIETRYHSSPSGLEVADMIAEMYRELVQGRDDVTITTFDHGSRTNQDSLVVRIEGQELPNEIIVLGSHIDSVNWRNGSRSRAPGADDNASGTATNLEIFRILMEEGITLKRTLEIHGYAAEEIGLVGSQDMARKYRQQGIDVIAMVQHDMNIYKSPGSEDKIWFVTSNTLGGFNDQLATLASHYAGLPTASASLSGGSSDHASWTRQGFAAAFPFENPRDYNHHIHTRNDTIANSGAFEQAAGFAKLGLGYVAHFGGWQR